MLPILTALRFSASSAPMTTRATLAVLTVALLLTGCGLSQRVKTQERWYPNYSRFRIEQKNVIVFVHGYGGYEDSFGFVPYLVARFPGRTIMYFNYETGPFLGRAYSIGVLAEDFRVFLHEKVFMQVADPARKEIDVICHSTGCPLVRQYVANNPFNHRIRRLLLVAGANYGAYYSETTATLKGLLPGLGGDKQISELRYGSFSLFHLQRRWHHLLVKDQLVRDGKPPEEPWLKPPFADLFRYVVSENTDADMRVPGQPLFKLPEVAAIVGTQGWRSIGWKRFSDGVVRVESAIPDCRSLAMASGLRASAHPEGPCEGRAIAFLPCSHTKLFSDQRCRQVILDLVDYFMRGRTDDRLLDAYVAFAREEALSEYLQRIRTGALWIRVKHAGLADPTTIRSSREWETILDRITVTIPRDRTERAWPFSFYEPDFAEAIRSSESGPDRIFYFKYVTGGSDLPVTIHVDGQAATIETPTRSDAHGRLVTRIHAGNTTMINCEEQPGAPVNALYCEETTSDVDTPRERSR